MDEIKTSIQNLDPKKASQKNMNTSKEKCGFFCTLICFSKVDNELREADVVPMDKKRSKLKYQWVFCKDYSW